ncbi:hypothetical protein EYF80_024751 [Liparis tanakae]|uniref:Uncharacterized protein n=1 Tax=Liparis tanakae TaxID=230148 RepID=A0A4Z2HJH1_9TELE|nr:hypothetical protein EYF80_024751 [Liparis tanakae]
MQVSGDNECLQYIKGFTPVVDLPTLPSFPEKDDGGSLHSSGDRCSVAEGRLLLNRIPLRLTPGKPHPIDGDLWEYSTPDCHIPLTPA